MIAGFILGISDGLSLAESFALATSFGSAACLSSGSLPPRKNKIEEIYKKIKIREGY